MEKSREAFEAHILSPPCAHPDDVRRTDGGSYEDSKVGLVWNGWQACDAHWREKLQSGEMVDVVSEAIYLEQGEKTNYLIWREFFRRQARAAIAAASKEMGV